MDIGKKVVQLLEKVGALKAESFEGEILSFQILREYLESAEFSPDGSFPRMSKEPTGYSYFSFLVQKQDNTVVGVVPYNMPYGKFQFKDSSAQFKVHSGGWMPQMLQKNPLLSVELSVPTPGGYVGQTVNFYWGNFYAETLKTTSKPG